MRTDLVVGSRATGKSSVLLQRIMDDAKKAYDQGDERYLETVIIITPFPHAHWDHLLGQEGLKTKSNGPPFVMSPSVYRDRHGLINEHVYVDDADAILMDVLRPRERIVAVSFDIEGNVQTLHRNLPER